MCLAVPARVVELMPDQRGIVEVGGVRQEVSMSLVVDEGIAVGEYVIVHVGFALRKVDTEEAEKTLELFAELIPELAPGATEQT